MSNRQGADIGTQYPSVILTQSEAQRSDADAMIRRLGVEGPWSGPIVTEVAPFTTFFPAEEGHQGYFRANAGQRYCQIVIAPKVAEFRKRHLGRLLA